MNILAINTIDTVGGAARVAWELGSEMFKKGHKIRYMVGYKKSNANNVFQLPQNKIINTLSNNFDYDLNYIFRYMKAYVFSNDVDYGAGNSIFKHRWYKEADVIHCHNLHGNFFNLESLIKMSKEKPVVWTLHDMWPITSHCSNCYHCKKWNKGKHFTRSFGKDQSILWNNSNYLWERKKEIYNKSKLEIVVPSLWLRNLLSNSILSDKPTRIINNGVKIHRSSYKKLTIKKRLGFKAKDKIILFIANGGARNKLKGGGHFNNIAANLKNINNIKFICIGGKRKYKKDNVVYLPHMNQKRLNMYYRASDIFLFPSLAENFPLVVLEAMSFGLPIVSFDVGGTKEQINHKINGYIAKYENEEDLFRGLKYILNMDIEKLTKMQKANIDRAKKVYNLENTVEEYLDLYEKLI